MNLMTNAMKLQKLRELLENIQKVRYHEPKAGWSEHCQGCGLRPYAGSPHREGCLVPRIAKVMEETK